MIVKFQKSTYVLLLIGVAVVAGTLNFAIAAPLPDLITNPALTFAGKGTQHALTFTTPTAGTIASIEVEFPDNTIVRVGEVMMVTAVDPSTGAIIDGTNLGTVTFANDGSIDPTIIYTFDTPITTPANTDWSMMIIKIRNPDVSGNINTSNSVTTKDGVGAIIDGPTSANFGLQELYQADDLLDAINSKSGDICIGSGCP